MLLLLLLLRWLLQFWRLWWLDPRRRDTLLVGCLGFPASWRALLQQLAGQCPATAAGAVLRAADH